MKQCPNEMPYCPSCFWGSTYREDHWEDDIEDWVCNFPQTTYKHYLKYKKLDYKDIPFKKLEKDFKNLYGIKGKIKDDKYFHFIYLLNGRTDLPNADMALQEFKTWILMELLELRLVTICDNTWQDYCLNVKNEIYKLFKKELKL